MIVSGLFEIFNSDFLSIFGLLGGIFILLVEFDEFQLPQLKDPLTRGLIWITLGFISFVQLLAIVLILVGGAFYVVYHYQ